VIQTFLSEILSEETQIRGRTARQGNRGSYSMVLVLEDLEKFGIGPREVENMRSTGKYYSILNQKRCKYFEEHYPESLRFMDNLKDAHDQSMSFLTSLLTKKDSSVIKEFLVNQNKAPVIDSGRVRTLCLLDATGSMTHLLVKAKNTVHEMFRRLEKVLANKGQKATVEIQVAVYRNYSSPSHHLMEFSGWESNPHGLWTFLETIVPRGGQGNEAIEVALHYAADKYESDNINQCVLIGDYPPNTREEVVSKRGGQGELYWSKTPYRQITFYQNELLRLKEQKLSVHCFWVAPYAKTAFREIAFVTGGRASALDIQSHHGADDLTDLLAEEILRKVGGDALVDEYTLLFGRGGRGFTENV